jgi:isoquinoline 1-oxidoreductase alpha subunit
MINLKVNGVSRQFDGEPDMPLLWFLRDELELTGTKYGCGEGLCGACTVHLNGAAVRSCQTPMQSAAGKSVVTIEGLSAKADHPVQQAWRQANVPQCGYCQSGQIMQAASLLKQKPKPTDADIDSAMKGNICRCGTYQRIREAIKAAASGKLTASVPSASGPAKGKVSATKPATGKTTAEVKK